MLLLTLNVTVILGEKKKTRQHHLSPADGHRRIAGEHPASLFSGHTPAQFSLRAVHLKVPPSGHLGKAFVFLELLLLFDFIGQEITKRFVACGGIKKINKKGGERV